MLQNWQQVYYWSTFLEEIVNGACLSDWIWIFLIIKFKMGLKKLQISCACLRPKQASFTVNRVALRRWKHECTCANKHSTALHSEIYIRSNHRNRKLYSYPKTVSKQTVNTPKPSNVISLKITALFLNNKACTCCKMKRRTIKSLLQDEEGKCG